MSTIGTVGPLDNFRSIEGLTTVGWRCSRATLVGLWPSLAARRL